MVHTWPAGANGIVVGGATVGVIAAEARADGQTLPLKLVAVLRIRTVGVASTFCSKQTKVKQLGMRKTFKKR